MKIKVLKEENQITDGGIRDFCSLFFPVLLMVFSSYLALFVEKIFLGRFSTETMEIAISTNYAYMIFQAPCTTLAMMAQVFIGRWYGARERMMIGPGIWQFIWFSLLSMVVIVPLGILYGKFYFSGTAIEQHALPYFHSLLLTNFLFPLGISLSCFYLGQGKIKLILVTTVVCQIIKIVLAYFLILGYRKWFPSLGLMGGIVSTAIAQGLFCIFLWVCFIRRKNASLYQSRSWHFQPKLFWHCIHPGLLRAMNRIFSLGCWAAISYLMTTKGDDYLLFFSIGSTLFIFFPFLSESTCQAQTTIVSQILGAEKYSSLGSALRSGSIFIGIMIVMTSIPFLIYPIPVFHFLFPHIALDSTTIQTLFLGIWGSFVFFVISHIPMGYILGFKDMKFFGFMGFFSWIYAFLFMYIAVEVVQIKALSVWLVFNFVYFTMAFLFWLRMKKNIRPLLSKQFLL